MKTMDKEFIPYEQALALKELGFDEPCFMYYTDNGELYKSNLYGISAPLYQQAFRWFREKHNLYVGPCRISYGDGPWLWTFEISSTITILVGDDCCIDNDYKTYEKAELACLDKLIEIVKEKQHE